MKSSKQKKAWILQPLLDFITGLPSTSRGHDAILIVIDKFSQMGHFIPTNATATSGATTLLFFDHIIIIHSIPATLNLDRDPKFTASYTTAANHTGTRPSCTRLRHHHAAAMGEGSTTSHLDA
ncbi:unnamed protein product [Closterium sp. NIES-54]